MHITAAVGEQAAAVLYKVLYDGNLAIASAEISVEQVSYGPRLLYSYILLLSIHPPLYIRCHVCSFHDLFHCHYRFTAGRWEEQRRRRHPPLSHQTLYNSPVARFFSAVILQVLIFSS